MTDKIQLRGHCQHCGRIQAVRGTMAKHGYTVDFGYFNGVCHGDSFQPIEKDRTKLDANIAEVNKQIDGDVALLADLKSGKKFPVQGRSRFGKTLPWAELNEYEQRQARETSIYHTESRIRAGKAWVEMMLKLADEVHGQPLQEVVQVKKAEIVVGSKVKLGSEEVIVEKIEEKRAQGIGPGINGKYVDHVFFTDSKGRARSYPKRYVRLVA